VQDVAGESVRDQPAMWLIEEASVSRPSTLAST
jgi:hypothetical protein